MPRIRLGRRVRGLAQTTRAGRPKASKAISPNSAYRRDMVKVLLIILCLFLPFLAVLIKDGPSMKVLWAFLLQLCGHIPGVIYGIYQVVQD
jgi:uncharacterized membrane protein YqaE (UPF0057 family)